MLPGHWPPLCFWIIYQLHDRAITRKLKSTVSHQAFEFLCGLSRWLDIKLRSKQDMATHILIFLELQLKRLFFSDVPCWMMSQITEQVTLWQSERRCVFILPFPSYWEAKDVSSWLNNSLLSGPFCDYRKFRGMPGSLLPLGHSMTAGCSLACLALSSLWTTPWL